MNIIGYIMVLQNTPFLVEHRTFDDVIKLRILIKENVWMGTENTHKCLSSKKTGQEEHEK